MEKKPTDASPAPRPLAPAAQAKHRDETPNIRGLTREDIEYTEGEVMEMLSRISLHQEEKDLLIARAKHKLGIWRRALEG